MLNRKNFHVMFAGILAAGLPVAGNASTDVSAVLKSWKQTRDACAAQAYRLEATGAVLRYAGGLSSHRIHWTTLSEQPRYIVRWHDGMSGNETMTQSYDGKRWYGLTTRGDNNEGLVAAHPERTPIGVNLDDHLVMQTSGLIWPRLSDVVDRPMSFDGKSLIEAYTRQQSLVTVSRSGSIITFTTSSANARKVALPHILELEKHGTGVYPSHVLYEFPNGEEDIHFSGYKPVDDVYYPTKIVEKLSVGRGANKKTVSLTSINLVATPTAVLSDAAFRISFPYGARVYDDRTNTVSVVGANLP